MVRDFKFIFFSSFARSAFTDSRRHRRFFCSIGGGGQGDEPNTTYSASISEKRMNNRVREARHAAQCILMDRELLMIHALSAHEVCIY